MFTRSLQYIYDLISVGNPNFASSIGTIYPKELELKETTESVNSCSYLDLFLFKDDNGRLESKNL